MKTEFGIAGRDLRRVPVDAGSIKRSIDVVLALIFGAVLCPIAIAAALGIRVFMGSPILFRQSRPGLGGRRFLMLKFRTMRNQPNGLPAVHDDQRLTALGKVLRIASIDEIPALFNVLKGEMSLVGPRPLLPKYQPYFTPKERARFQVRPGITGLAQVRGRNCRDWDSRFADDLEYVHSRGILVDLRIMARTVMVTVLGRGLKVDPTSHALDLDVERARCVQIVDLGADSADIVAALISRAYDQKLFPCSPVFEAGFPSIVRGWLDRGDQVFGLLHFGQLAAVAQIRAISGGKHLNHFAVLPMHQGWGIAELLLTAVHRRFSDQRITLHVDARSRRAESFYRRLGYRCVSSEQFVMCLLDVGPGTRNSSGLGEQELAVLRANGFCKVLPAGHGASFTVLAGDRAFIGDDFPASEVAKVGDWLGRGRVVMPERLLPLGWSVCDRWQRLLMVNDQSTSNMTRSEG
jgi:sugar transferase EpsL